MSHLADQQDVLPGGIMGRILRVDLTTEQISVEPLTPSVARMWLGGTGLGARILYDEVPAGVEWDSPQNRLIIAAGPLAGTKVHGAGTCSAVTRGPMTNLLGATQANGFFGAYLKQNGYDASKLKTVSCDPVRITTAPTSSALAVNRLQSEVAVATSAIRRQILAGPLWVTPAPQCAHCWTYVSRTRSSRPSGSRC